MLGVHLNVNVKIEALQVRADLSSGWDIDWQKQDGISQIDSNLLSLLVLDKGNLIATLLSSEEGFVPLQTELLGLSSVSFDELTYVMWLDLLD